MSNNFLWNSSSIHVNWKFPIHKLTHTDARFERTKMRSASTALHSFMFHDGSFNNTYLFPLFTEGLNSTLTLFLFWKAVEVKWRNTYWCRRLFPHALFMSRQQQSNMNHQLSLELTLTPRKTWQVVHPFPLTFSFMLKVSKFAPRVSAK